MVTFLEGKKKELKNCNAKYKLKNTFLAIKDQNKKTGSFPCFCRIRKKKKEQIEGKEREANYFGWYFSSLRSGLKHKRTLHII